MVSRVSVSVITVGVYHVTVVVSRVYLCYYFRCISGSKVWLVECLSLLLL